MVSKLERSRLLEPGYAGFLDDSELSFILGALSKSKALALRWGFKSRMKIHSRGVCRVALHGSVDSQRVNASLVRPKTSPLRAVKALTRA